MKLCETVRRSSPGEQPASRSTVLKVSRYLRCVMFLAMFCFFASGLLAQPDSSQEYSVKAAFLFHFAQFVEWPKDSFKDAGSPLIYCTFGPDPFRGALDDTLNGKSIDTHALQVRHAKQAQDLKDCHVVFLGQLQKEQLSGTLALLKGSPVLVVGESDHFVQAGGMIGFFLDENKIRFDINLETARNARLKINARLLSLARTVIGAPKRD